VKKKNPRIGSSFESWLDETGIREDVTVAAIKSVLARQPAAAQLDRLLDPDNAARPSKAASAHVVEMDMGETVSTPGCPSALSVRTT